MIPAIVVLLAACNPDGGQLSRAATPALELPRTSVDAGGTASALSRDAFLAALTRLAQQPGVELHRLADDGSAPFAVALGFDSQRFEAVLFGTSARQALAADAVAVVGSGFVSLASNRQPVGLLRIDGVTISPLEIHGYTRVLGVTSGRFDVIHRSDYNPERFVSALQAGPGVVEQGQLDISERDLARPRYFRSFVASCANSTLIGASLEPMHLYTLGGALVQLSQREQLGCAEVVNLAGDREAVLGVADAAGLALHGYGEKQQAVLIGIRRRGEPAEPAG